MNNAIQNLQNELSGVEVKMNQMPNMVQSGTAYSTAMQVIKERNLQKVTNKCLTEAAIAGDNFYYSWSQSGKIIEGLTIGAALAIVRNFGNCSVDVKIEETPSAYIFHGIFVDLETGFNMSRPFRQNKQSPKSKSGKDIYTGERGKDIIFQIGASKAIRNVVLNACPNWLTQKVIEKAKENVFSTISKLGPVKALEMITKKASNLDVDLEQIERHYGKSKHWDNEKFVMVSSALKSIEDGYETVESIFQGTIQTKPETKQISQPQTPTTQPLYQSQTANSDLFNNPNGVELPN